jgi:succinate dehydrogenase / fumarate reductase cytochrome b subunit
VARPSAQPLKRRAALVLAVVVAGGFLAIPVAALAGRFPVVEVHSAPTTSPVEAH